MYSDVVEIVEQVGEKVDTILVPKAGTASDVYMVDCLLTQIETNKKIKNKIGIECLIETALGMSNIKEIATSSSRLEALHFGVADYAASLRARTVVIGGLVSSTFLTLLVVPIVYQIFFQSIPNMFKRDS